MGTRSAAQEPERPYHHGSLKEAMLTQAERILRTEGLSALSLRRAAREAGASHAAHKNHFGNFAGLLSELAAVGFRRLSAMMEEEGAGASTQSERLLGLGRGYIHFARENPALFLLMFRSDRLDQGNRALSDAGGHAFQVLATTLTGSPAENSSGELSLEEASAIAEAWARVHGLSMLLLDGRLGGLLTSARASEDELISVTLGRIYAWRGAVRPSAPAGNEMRAGGSDASTSQTS